MPSDTVPGPRGATYPFGTIQLGWRAIDVLAALQVEAGVCRLVDHDDRLTRVEDAADVVRRFLDDLMVVMPSVHFDAELDVALSLLLTDELEQDRGAER